MELNSHSYLSRLENRIASIDVKVAVKIALAAGLSLVVQQGFTKILHRSDVFISGLWSVMASIVVMQLHLGSTYQAAWMRFLGVFIGSIMGGLIISFLGAEPVIMSIGVFLTIVICSILGIKEGYRIASLSTAFIIISAASKPDIDPWLFSFFRFIDSCIGIIVALSVSYFIWPETALKELRDNTCQIFSLIRHYYRFSTNLNVETASDLKFENDLNKELIEAFEKNYVYKEEALYEVRYHEGIFPNWALITNETGRIFEAISFLKELPKTTLIKMFDDDLLKAISKVTEETEAAFKLVEKNLSLNIPIVIGESLPHSLELLNTELLRFRGTHTTRKFSLPDVQDFYVFFHNLRYIGEAIIKL